MNVLFVYTRETAQSPVKPLVDFEAIQFGISYISSLLKKNGHKTRLLVMTRASDFKCIDESLAAFPAQLVCFTSVASEFTFVTSIARYFRMNHPGVFRLAGGPHVSLNAEEDMLDPVDGPFNALCIGEGEYATLDLATQIETGKTVSGIRNLWLQTSTGVEKNPTRSFIQNLDELPYPDREMWDEWIDFDRSAYRPSLILGRGCPFECSYCCNHSLKKLADGKYVRFRSPGNVIGEINDILTKYKKVKEFYFEVETLGADLPWARELCNQLEELNRRRSHALSFGANLRVCPPVVRAADELMADLKRANFRFLHIGLESGSDRVRREVLSRHYTNEDFLKVVAAAKRQSFQVILFDLIGLPNETVADFAMTVEANRQAAPDWYYLSIFYPYPGTNLHRMCRELGVLPENLLTTEKERVKATLDYPTFSRSQIQKAFICFDYYVFKDRKPTEWLADRVIDKYQMVYSGRSGLYIRFRMLLDYVNPSLKLIPAAQENRLYGWILRKWVGPLFQLPANILRAIMSRRPRPAKQGPVVAQPVGRSLQAELLEEYVRRTWECLGRRGSNGTPWRIAIFGAGSHTAWLNKIVTQIKPDSAPVVKAVLDENPQPERRFWGLAPVKPEAFDPAGVDAILLSSDVFAETMKTKLQNIYGNKVVYLNMYENLPPGPYPKV